MILEKDFFSLFKYFGILSSQAMELLYIPYYIWKVAIFTLQKRIKKKEKIRKIIRNFQKNFYFLHFLPVNCLFLKICPVHCLKLILRII